jgi:hypothetical protein
MELQKSYVGRTRRSEIDRKREYKCGQHETGSQPVHESRGSIKDSFGIADSAHCSDSSIGLARRISERGMRRSAKLIRYDESRLLTSRSYSKRFVGLKLMPTISTLAGTHAR